MNLAYAGDIDAQVAAGAEHITFGDPDFFNGPTHAMRIVESLHAAHPRLILTEPGIGYRWIAGEESPAGPG